MRKYLYIGLGGFLGAIARYELKGIDIPFKIGDLPVNILIINISGSFILAFFLLLTLKLWEIDEDLRLGISTGFLGAYTTFSTLCKEVIQLLDKGEYFPAAWYLTASALLGLAAAYLGVLSAKKFITSIAKKGLYSETDGEVD